MLKFIKWIFHHFFSASLQSRVRGFRSFLLDIFIPIYRIDKSGLTVILIGHESFDPYIIQQLYGENLPGKKVDRVLAWNIDRGIQRWEARADLVFFRSSRFRLSGTVASRMLVLPHYVEQGVDLPPSTSDLFSYFRSLKGKSRRSDLKRIRKTQFEYKITNDAELLSYFYHHLYVPYIENRHQDSASFPPWSVFQSLYGGKELMLMYEGDQIVAGKVAMQIGNTYRTLVSAIQSDDPEFLKKGVWPVFYWFTFVEAHRRGCSKVDLGTCRPFLKDGVLMYKKKWCNRLTTSIHKRNLELFLLPCGNRPAMYSVFEDNPFFCERGGRLTGLIFLGEHTVLDNNGLAIYLKQIVVDGECLSICVVLLTQGWAAREEAVRSILSNYSQQFSILDLSGGSIAELPGLL